MLPGQKVMFSMLVWKNMTLEHEKQNTLRLAYGFQQGNLVI